MPVAWHCSMDRKAGPVRWRTDCSEPPRPGLIAADPNFQDAAVLGATFYDDDDDDGGSIVGLSSATDADGGDPHSNDAKFRSQNRQRSPASLRFPKAVIRNTTLARSLLSS
jgi:hypothetical protein